MQQVSHGDEALQALGDLLLKEMRNHIHFSVQERIKSTIYASYASILEIMLFCDEFREYQFLLWRSEITESCTHFINIRGDLSDYLDMGASQ